MCGLISAKGSQNIAAYDSTSLLQDGGNGVNSLNHRQFLSSWSSAINTVISLVFFTAVRDCIDDSIILSAGEDSGSMNWNGNDPFECKPFLTIEALLYVLSVVYWRTNRWLGLRRWHRWLQK